MKTKDVSEEFPFWGDCQRHETFISSLIEVTDRGKNMRELDVRAILFVVETVKVMFIIHQ